ncbi:hypothetical protein [Amycolatopsis thermophila]|uniref:PE family protein n=1 Tax=Amycolatopsis thermophila TaxID=206084 RepID=A0ABU0F796_9PSEU|nr:hypothetical protein [Amycolatopsis thermophila]MDQ0382986.1 hypothetical protein [Amycolatopsis thermophila]
MGDWTDVGAGLGDAGQLQAMEADTKRLLDSARAGNWAVDEETGTHLRRAVTTMLDRLAGIQENVRRLKRAPKFGNDEYARTAAAHFQKAMDSDENSLVPVYEALRVNLNQLVHALDEAMARYDASDEAATQHLGKFKD